MTDNNDKPTPAYVLNHARLFSKGEIVTAWGTLDERQKRIWRGIVARGASGDTGKDLVAIRAAIGKE